MTICKYMEDTYIFENTSEITEIGENNFGKYIILNETIFYPQGGGQPNDIGIIVNEEGTFNVEMVKFDENKEKNLSLLNLSGLKSRKVRKSFFFYK